MASGNMPPEPSDSMICHICMDVYRNPKFLPCHHSFCAHCIQDWANQHQNNSSSSFPCPVCRRNTSLPRGGVASLQTNFYLPDEELQKAREGKLCPNHPRRKLELFCVPCKQIICLKCKLHNHGPHLTQELAEVVNQKFEELMVGGERVEKVITEIVNMSKVTSENLKTHMDQIALAKRVVHTIHSILTRAANTFQHVIQTLLLWYTYYVVRILKNKLYHLHTQQQKLEEFMEQLLAVSISEDGQKMSVMAEELNSGKRSQKSLSKMMSCRQNPYFLSQILTFLFALMIAAILFSVFLIQSNSIFSKDREGFSTVSFVPFKLVEQFKCAEERDTVVHSICPTNDSVWVSYAQRGLKEDAVSQNFNKSGAVVATHGSAKGKVSWARVDHGPCVFWTGTFSKRGARLKLFQLSSGTADIRQVVKYEAESQVLQTISKLSINVGAHRAFDASAMAEVFVVVEEGQSPDLQRKVKMFRKPHADAFATYSPQNRLFQPADVCFYWLGQQEVLLVADEWNNHIHMVVLEQDKTVKPLGYFPSGCPQFTAPTALNVDDVGDLWVACQGGSIVKGELMFYDTYFFSWIL